MLALPFERCSSSAVVRALSFEASIRGRCADGLNDRARFSSSPCAPTFGWGAARPLESLNSARSHCLWLVLERSTFALAHLGRDDPCDLGTTQQLDCACAKQQVLDHVQAELSSDPCIDHKALLRLWFEGGTGNEVDQHLGFRVGSTQFFINAA